MKRHIPNTITCLNLASGFIAIIFAFNGSLATASWLILAAMTFDFFDGFSARTLKAYSDIGKELDSLADMVSFGVAPAIILYKQMELSLGLSAPYDLLSLNARHTLPKSTVISIKKTQYVSFIYGFFLEIPLKLILKLVIG